MKKIDKNVMNNSIANMPENNSFQAGFEAAVSVVDDIVLKNYISHLREMEIIPLDQSAIENNITENVRLFKITEMVYEKDEFAFHKFASVFNTLSSSECSVFLLIDSDGDKTDFYMGIRAVDPELDAQFLSETLENALFGQFPGIKTEEKDTEEINKIRNRDTNAISIVSCVANVKDEEIRDNASFVQGLEKLALAMQGKVYTAVILADSTSQYALDSIRKSYEEIYTNLSPYAKYQVGYSTNNSVTTTHTESESTSHGTTVSDSEGLTSSVSKGTSYSKTKKPLSSILASGATIVANIVGSALAVETGGASLVASSAVSAAIAPFAGNTETHGTTQNHTEGTTITHSESEMNNVNKGSSKANGITEGTSNNLTLNIENKTISGMLERLDTQLERLHEFESLGMWECSAYFMSSQPQVAEIAASTYKSIMRGKNSGVEIGAINSWRHYEKKDVKLLNEYVSNFIHPKFSYHKSDINDPIIVTPCSLVSGNELAIHMGLPRKSVCGFPVIEHADFGKEVVNYEHGSSDKYINLGKIFNMGSESKKSSVKLDVESLSMHTFVTGSTGSGKSNTVYELLKQLELKGIHFMVVEPAKGEYKNVFGNNRIYRTNVYGTNPQFTDLLRINPFAFPKGIHVLEHIDRLVEIFNVCWPMYAAMPAVLKEAMLQAYEVCGWDLTESVNRYDNSIFPTFKDLLLELINVIDQSAYDQEVKSNYKGSLETRVKSLTNGLNGKIFCSGEIDGYELFDKNVVIDLSRIGSMETKSLIMGILVMKLSEYRMTYSEGMNIPLKHVTVLEEAHNILKRTSSDQSQESSNVAGKSVEMISNAIAEMRTYGEGFIIADQSPTAVDISAIKNTNTKIIMRLPEEEDRRLAGKSAALKDEQLDEIAKLPKGVAVVYQNNWIEPVLCKIKKYEGDESVFVKPDEKAYSNKSSSLVFYHEYLKLLLKDRVSEDVDIDIDKIEKAIQSADLSSKNKLIAYSLINEYKQTGSLTVWKQKNFERLSMIVSDLTESKDLVKRYANDSLDFDELCSKLAQLITSFDERISSDLSLAVSQCLMKAFGCENQTNLEIYSAWREFVCNKGRLI